MQESVAKITSVVDKMIVRCDEIAACAQDRNKKACNLFAAREARKTADLCLAKLARPLSVPLRQIFLLCSQKLHEQLTVGC